MIIGVPKEIAPGERRVALVPESVARLVKRGHEVLIEVGAGVAASFADEMYVAVGARLVELGELYSQAHVIAKVARPMISPQTGIDEVAVLHPETVVIAFLSPLQLPGEIARLAASGVTSMSMEMIPRVTRAQAMDALSSQSSLAGYKAVLLAADALPRFFPMLTTAAGTIPPARVLVLGAGVAGLQAIATARRLGAVVTAYDTRSVVAEQVKSLGAAFLTLELGEQGDGAGGYARELSEHAVQRQREQLAQHAAAFDVVITTALIPGRPAPLLLTTEAVRGMRPGSVIVDLAGEAGGNCELSSAGTRTEYQGVTILAPLNVPSSMPQHASALYARNVATLIDHLTDAEGHLQLDFADEITSATCVTHAGQVTNTAVRELLAHAG